MARSKIKIDTNPVANQYANPAKEKILMDKYAGKSQEETAPTAVIFRKWPQHEGGAIIALFPYEPGDSRSLTCDSFEHVGQHGAADPAGVIRRTTPAQPGEYAALKRELESNPYEYRLRVLRRLPPDAAEVRSQALGQAREAALRQAREAGR